MQKRILSLILCAMFVFSAVAFAACAEKNDTGSDDTSAAGLDAETTELTEEEKRNAVTDDIPELDFEGAKFRIITRDGSSHPKPIHVDDVYMEKATGDVIDDAVFARNQAVEERFNMEITCRPMSEADEALVSSELRKSVNANSDDYDLAIGHMVHMGNTVTTGIFYNWFDIPYVNLEKPWWIQSAQEQLTIDGKSFLALGDLSYNAIDYTYCYYFNKTLFDNYNIEYPYAKVRSLEWTVDYMKSIVKDIYDDVNGNSKRDEDDLYGLVTNCYSGAVTWTYAFGEMIMKRGDDGYPELVLNNEKTIRIVEKLYDLYFETTGVYVSPNTTTPNGTPWHETSWKAIQNEKAALVSGLFNDSTLFLREAESDYGFLPYPKWDEAQTNYYTMVDGHAPLFGIPITIGDAEFVGAIIEAMAAEGYKKVTPAYYEVALKTKYTRDEESAEMIDLILDGRVFDFGYLYDGWNGLAFYLQNLLGFGKQTKDFSSYYAKSEKAANKYYQKIFKTYDDYGT